VAGSTARGEVFGRRDHGWNAASPSSRYRANSWLTQPGDTPYAGATSACERPSTTTPVITSRAFDMAEHRTPTDVSYVLRDAFPMS
jgi:hypothetical protein